MNDEKHCLYWLRYKEHDDIFSEGYVGVSKNYVERIKYHKRWGSKQIRNLNWDNTICTEIVRGDEFDIYYLESLFRPKLNIGWNIRAGGLSG